MQDTGTLLDAVDDALDRASGHNPQYEVAPAALLWPDGPREWEPLLPLLQERRPVLRLGAYDREAQCGGGSWVRWMLEQVLPSQPVPVVYLPGEAAVAFRRADESSELGGEDVGPLVELRYRGVVWQASRSKDWTIRGFLSHPIEGLGVDVRPGRETDRALRRALPKLARLEVRRLRDEAPWRASDFDVLMGFAPKQAGPTIHELITQGESQHLEFKATARTNATTGAKMKLLESVILKSVAAFLNSQEGGTLLIGIRDDGSVHGIEPDYAAWSVPAECNPDKYENWLMSSLLLGNLGAHVMPLVRATFPVVDGKTICRVDVLPGHRPVYVKYEGKESFFVRTSNASPPLPLRDAVEYSLRRWGKPDE